LPTGCAAEAPASRPPPPFPSPGPQPLTSCPSPLPSPPLQLWNGAFSLGDLGADLLGALIAGAIILGIQYHDARQQQLWLLEQGEQGDVEKPKGQPGLNPGAMRRSRSGLLKY
jgi:hypothetical protein